MARYFLSAMMRWKTLPVRSWATLAPVEFMRWAVVRRRSRMRAAAWEGSRFTMSRATAKMGQ